MMKIVVASVFVDDHRKALKFYTEKLGFVKKTEVPLGEASWLTVVSPSEPDGVELLLEPNSHPAVRTIQAGVGRGWHSVRVLRCGRCSVRIREAETSWRGVHAAAGRHGVGDHGRARRHLWESGPACTAESGESSMTKTVVAHVAESINDLKSTDKNRQNPAYRALLDLTAERVDWAYEVWDDLPSADGPRR